MKQSLIFFLIFFPEQTKERTNDGDNLVQGFSLCKFYLFSFYLFSNIEVDDNDGKQQQKKDGLVLFFIRFDRIILIQLKYN